MNHGFDPNSALESLGSEVQSVNPDDQIQIDLKPEAGLLSVCKEAVRDTRTHAARRHSPKHFTPPMAYAEAARGLLVTSASSPKYCPLVQRAISTSALSCLSAFVWNRETAGSGLYTTQPLCFLTKPVHVYYKYITCRIKNGFKSHCYVKPGTSCFINEKKTQKQTQRKRTYFALHHDLHVPRFHNVKTVGFITLKKQQSCSVTCYWVKHHQS